MLRSKRGKQAARLLGMAARGLVYVAVAVFLVWHYYPDPPPPDPYGDGDGTLNALLETGATIAILIVLAATVALGELATHLHRDRRRRLQWLRSSGTGAEAAGATSKPDSTQQD